MSYLSKLSRNKRSQAVIGDWLSINSLRLQNASVSQIMNMGFSIDTAKILVNGSSYDDAIIASLESTHRDETLSQSIFVSNEANLNFSKILDVKTKEFEELLTLMAFQCPVDRVCEFAPIFIENKRVAARVRKEYRKKIIELSIELLKKKRLIYENYNLTDEEIESECNIEVKGRVRILCVEEFMNIDKAIELAKENMLVGIEKYIFVAREAGVYINQIYYRESMLNS